MGLTATVVFKDLINAGYVSIPFGCTSYVSANILGKLVDGSQIYIATYNNIGSAGGRRLVVYKVTNEGVVIQSIDGKNVSYVYFDRETRQFLINQVKDFYRGKIRK